MKKNLISEPEDRGNPLDALTAPPAESSAHEFYRRQELDEPGEAIDLLMHETGLSDRGLAAGILATVRAPENRAVIFGAGKKLAGETAAAAEGKWRGLAATMLKILQYIKDHPERTAIYAALHVWDIPLFDDLNNHLNQKQFAETIIAKKMGAAEIAITKAAVNNAVKDARRFFGTAPRRDMRTLATCAKQSKKRISQLKG